MWALFQMSFERRSVAFAFVCFITAASRFEKYSFSQVDILVLRVGFSQVDILVLRVGSLGAGSVGFEGQNQFPQSCSSIFRHRVSSCCSISLFMYFNSNFSTGGTAHGSLESICLDPGDLAKNDKHTSKPA